jgi:chaperonin GroEL (HSP60 family)
MTTLESLDVAEREFESGNHREASRILWKATEATFDMLAKAHGLDSSDHIAVATELDQKYDLRFYYRGKLITGKYLRDHADMGVLEDYELEEPRDSQPRFIRECYLDFKADDPGR